MVDITRVQLNPIPPPIVELQNTNAELINSHNITKKVLFAVGIIVVVYLINRINAQIKEINEKRNSTKNTK
jgi:hypothetical protein